MSATVDDALLLRLQDTTLTDSLSQVEQNPAFGMPSLIAQTSVISHYPTSAQVFYACLPLTVLGSEVEGGSAVFSAGSAKFFALNLGVAIPPVGTRMVTTFVESRWVFRYDG